jgi:hypothetical protein
MKKGDRVRITVGDHTVEGVILLASSNGVSLMLGFEAALGNPSGLYVGSMPVMLHDDGYRDLVHQEPVKIEKL